MPHKSMLIIGAGVDRTFPNFPIPVEGTTFELSNPVKIAGEVHDHLNIRIHNLEPKFAPKGKTVLTSAIKSYLGYWKALSSDSIDYQAEKEKIAQAYVNALDQIWPGISGQVEMCNIATPLTFQRITGNYQASITGWTSWGKPKFRPRDDQGENRVSTRRS